MRRGVTRIRYRAMLPSNRRRSNGSGSGSYLNRSGPLRRVTTLLPNDSQNGGSMKNLNQGFSGLRLNGSRQGKGSAPGMSPSSFSSSVMSSPVSISPSVNTNHNRSNSSDEVWNQLYGRGDKARKKATVTLTGNAQYRLRPPWGLDVETDNVESNSGSNGHSNDDAYRRGAGFPGSPTMPLTKQKQTSVVGNVSNNSRQMSRTNPAPNSSSQAPRSNPLSQTARPSRVSENKRQQSMSQSQRGTSTSSNDSEVPEVPRMAYTNLVCGVAENANRRWRPSMEDKHTVAYDMGWTRDELTTGRKDLAKRMGSREAEKGRVGGFFAVYDGHGGVAVARYVSERLHHILDGRLKASRQEKKNGEPMRTQDIYDVIQNSVLQCDKEVADSRIGVSCGTTMCMAWILPAEQLNKDTQEDVSQRCSRVLWVANSGDSRAVLAFRRPLPRGVYRNPRSGYEAVRLSCDHKPDTHEEMARIKAGGGFVRMGRVGGILAVSRAIGDHHLTRLGVIPNPYVSRTYLSPDCEFVIIACDGLWDVVADQEAVRHVGGLGSAQEMADALCTLALRKGTTDNVSVMVVSVK